MSSSALALLAKLACTSTLLLVPLACGGDSSKAEPDASRFDGAAEADAGQEAGGAVCQSAAGTRLTREYIEPSLGAREEFRILDVDLGEACNFLAEADGSFTCYPNNFERLVLFQDAACTTAIVGVVPGAVPQTFARARRLSDGACFLGSHFRRVGMPSAVEAGQSVFTQDTAGTCSAVSAPARDYYLAGSELPLSSFVSASRGPVDAAARISAAVYEGSDGSSMCDVGGASLDNDLGAPCFPGVLGDSELYCVPAGRTSTEVFSNAGCSEENTVVVVDRCEDEPPAFAATQESLDCGVIATTLERVSSEALAQRFDNGSGSCVADSSTDRFFPTTDLVTGADLAGLSERVEDGDARLRRVVVGDGQGFVGFNGVWRDTNLETNCVFAAAADGSYRCLPESVSLTTYFIDETCIATIRLANVDTCQAGRTHFQESAPMGKRVRATSLYEGALFERVDGGLCAGVVGTFLEPAFELSPSSFVLGTVEEL